MGLVLSHWVDQHFAPGSDKSGVPGVLKTKLLEILTTATNFDETSSDHYTLQKEASDLLGLLQRHGLETAQMCMLRPMQMTLTEMASLSNVDLLQGCEGSRLYC